ncbi:uncharacterized protein RJT21DRAFT_113436 [Scheffersomyces amazonensis]|uniref:uncharacterized protein n=1 Tax=Scheffersomyces amazonensis TaxID=1078765 RepID=UPI00315CA96C
MEDDLPLDILQERLKKIMIRFFSNQTNRQNLLRTAAYLDSSEGILRSNNSQLQNSRIRGMTEIEDALVTRRNIRKIVYQIIHAQYFISPPPFIQVERSFANNLVYPFICNQARKEAIRLLTLLSNGNLSYYENAIGVSMLFNLTLPTHLNTTGFNENTNMDSRKTKGTVSQTYSNSYHRSIPNQFYQPGMFDNESFQENEALNAQQIPITFEQLRAMQSLSFDLLELNVTNSIEFHLSTDIHLTILNPVASLLNSIFRRNRLFKDVTVLSQTPVHSYIIPDFIFRLRTSRGNYYLPIEVKFGNLDRAFEAARNGNLNDIAEYGAQISSQAFSCYSPMALLISEKYLIVFKIPFDLERGSLKNQFFENVLEDERTINEDDYKLGNFDVTIVDHTNGRNPLALTILKLAYDRFENYSTIEVTKAINKIWSEHAKTPDIKRMRARAPCLPTNTRIL